MYISRENALNTYQKQYFLVVTRENIFDAKVISIIDNLIKPKATQIFLQSLSQPNMSIWEAFFISIKSRDVNLQEEVFFSPFRDLLTQVTNVAILYGEHFSWKSPEKWSYLFEVMSKDSQVEKQYIIVHALATLEHISQAEKVLGIHLPMSYQQFLRCSNGLGLALNETYYICGVGDARADWNTVNQFQEFDTSAYHEISSNWLEWRDVYRYEKQRDQETSINSFLSDLQQYIPFALTIDSWCFKKGLLEGNSESQIFFWDHELREASYQFPTFEQWFRDILHL